MSPDEVALAAQLAALFEVASEKPGNVTPRHSFDDMRLTDFLVSAAAIGPAMRAAATQTVGATILQAVRATRRLTTTNTNLGIILLFAPLAHAALTSPDGEAGLRRALEEILHALTVEDAVLAYEAIRLAQPGGLGDVQDQDVAQVPTITLREAMGLAAERDAIAREYVRAYAITFEIGLPAFRDALVLGVPIEDAVLVAFLTILGRVPDTLIARKMGMQEAEAVSARAREVLPEPGTFLRRGVSGPLAAFDASLRAAGNRRNPGTTADLTAATIFAALLIDGLEAVLQR